MGMNLIALILGIFALAVFLFSGYGYYRKSPTNWHLSIGLALFVGMVMVQLLTTSHPIHF